MSAIDRVDLPYIITIFASSFVGIVWACMQYQSVNQIDVLKEEGDDADPEHEPLTEERQKICESLKVIGEKISTGANAFLWAEYRIMGIFIVQFSIIIYCIVDFLGAKDKSGTKYIPFATISFIIGAITSISCGYIGMKIAVLANFRTTYKCMTSII